MNLEEEQRRMRERNWNPIRNATKTPPPSKRGTKRKKQLTWREKTPLDLEIMKVKTSITEAQKRECTSHAVPKLRERLRILEATRKIDRQLR
jgi:hypothetical protein